MGIVSSLLGSASTAVSGFSIGTWIKIGAVIAVALAFAGLYGWGQYEQNAHNAAEQKIGIISTQLATANAQITADQSAIANWKSALSQLEAKVAEQQDAIRSAEAQKEKFDATLQHLEAQLRGNPSAAASNINRTLDQLVCMLDRASGGTDQCAGAAADTSKIAAPGAAKP